MKPAAIRAKILGPYFQFFKSDPFSSQLQPISQVNSRTSRGRLARAGSDAVVIASPGKIALAKKLDREASVEQILSLLGDDYDAVLLEGFKRAGIPKIEVHRKEAGELMCPPGELIAIISDEPLNVGIRQFSADQVGLLADFLEEHFAIPATPHCA